MAAYGGTGMAQWPDNGKLPDVDATYNMKTNVDCEATSVTSVNCPALQVRAGCLVSVNWTGVGSTVDVPSGECVDLTFTANANNANGFFFQCAAKSAIPGTCNRVLTATSGANNTNNRNCNEHLTNQPQNILVYYNLTGNPTGGGGSQSGKTYTDEITLEAFNGTTLLTNITFTCKMKGDNGNNWN
jgi:hypothetical protein